MSENGSIQAKSDKSGKSFKERYTFEERLAEARKKKEMNPKLLPIIVEKHKRSKLPPLDKSK